MVTLARYPVAPTITPRRGTLLDAAKVADGIEWLDGTDLFDSYNCMSFGAAAEFCAPNSKTLDQSAEWQQGFRFAAYGGLQCSTVGFDSERAMSEVSSVFAAGESTAVERGLMETRFVAEGGGLWPAATDITPTNAVTPAVGLALLEGYAASVYAGVPTIHMPITIASLLSDDKLDWDGSLLRTVLGSKVAAGAGYDLPNSGPTGAAAADGEKWLYASGEVSVQRSGMVLRDAVDHEENTIYVLAERGYIAAVDCFTAAIRVTVTD